MKPVVYVAKPGLNYEDVYRTVFMMLDRLWIISKLRIEPRSRILVKPNLTIDKPWTTGATVCPYLVEAIVRWFQMKIDDCEVIVGEGSMLGVDTFKSFEVCGYLELADRLGIELVDLNRQPTVTVEVADGKVLKEIEVAKTVLESDFIVNVAKLKTHILTLVSLGMKNMKGILPYKGKKAIHFLGLEHGIVDLNSIVKPDLTFIDGLIGMEGFGPLVGEAIELGIIVAGFDVVSVDSIASYMMGVDPYEVLHIRYAGERGLGVLELDRVKVYGLDPSIVRRPFKLPPRSIAGDYPGVHLILGDPCSGCIGSIATALTIMKESAELKALIDMYGCLTVAIGPKARLDESKGLTVLCGRCLYRTNVDGIFIPGCPPQSYLIRDILRTKIGLPPIYVSEDVVREAEEFYR
ncbi:MAG: DUF362 domain-containing protein [Nitrososphaerota archaeon]|nr:DUF362 domain-containing protein [Candidatus Bathyarchaeota archaeon]MCX8162796.1 DUF362 domain-containing protein [Candidatus Bathyarchaeota archaeon]MDW8061461.1 DUF362 domain-containing protein [Nitrososphaerota archaeon]